MATASSFTEIIDARQIHHSEPISAFRAGKYETVRELWQHGLNELYWTHGIVISQGNRMCVSNAEAIRRMNSIKRHLLRQMFGNHYRNSAKIEFLMFQHGSYETEDQHFHALMHIEGNHNWSHFRIAMTINSIEFMRHVRNKTKQPWEKKAHVDWGWTNENRYHGYVSRYANWRPDTWCIVI